MNTLTIFKFLIIFLVNFAGSRLLISSELTLPLVLQFSAMTSIMYVMFSRLFYPSLEAGGLTRLKSAYDHLLAPCFLIPSIFLTNSLHWFQLILFITLIISEVILFACEIPSEAKE